MSWQNLNRLQVGQKIEVLNMNSGSLNGTFLGFSEEAISLRVGIDEVAVPRAKVLRVRLPEPKCLRNAAIAAAVGVGAGLAIAVPLLYPKAQVFSQPYWRPSSEVAPVQA